MSASGERAPCPLRGERPGRGDHARRDVRGDAAVEVVRRRRRRLADAAHPEGAAGAARASRDAHRLADARGARREPRLADRARLAEAAAGLPDAPEPAERHAGLVEHLRPGGGVAAAKSQAPAAAAGTKPEGTLDA